jgi:hypothetical protein
MLGLTVPPTHKSFTNEIVWIDGLVSGEPMITRQKYEKRVPCHQLVFDDHDSVAGRGKRYQACPRAQRQRLSPVASHNDRPLRVKTRIYRTATATVAQGKLDEALKAYRDSLAIAERLAAADRSNSEWQRDLAISHSKLASVYERQRRIADALQELTQGRDIMAALVAIAPGNTQWKNDLAWFEQQIARLRGRARAR